MDGPPLRRPKAEAEASNRRDEDAEACACFAQAKALTDADHTRCSREGAATPLAAAHAPGLTGDWRGVVRSGRGSDHEAVGARLGAPYLAVTAEQLADVRSLLRQPEALEAPAGGIEAHE
jgi:hypothetical protein